MDNLTDSNARPSRQSKHWLRGGAIGCIGGLLLLFITYAIGLIPFFGFIFLGQYLLIQRFVFLVYSSLYGDSISNGLNFYVLNIVVILFIYSTIWGVIGALFASKRKKQVIIATISIVIYVIVGLLAFNMYGSTIFPT